MQNELDSNPIELNTFEIEKLSEISNTEMTTAPPLAISTSSNARDSVSISEEALLLASTIVPSLQEQKDHDRFNMLIALQGGLVGPGGAMINIASTLDPVYAVVKKESISISRASTSSSQNTESTQSAQNTYNTTQSTTRMLEYVQNLIQNVRIEEEHSLQESLMNMVNSLANVMEELVGDPNYNQEFEALKEAFRTISSIMIADYTRVEYSYMPDNEQMIFEARDMADMFNNLLFESLIKYNMNVKESFDKAWSAL